VDSYFCVPDSGLFKMTHVITFFLLASIIVVFAVLSITARDPIRSILFLFAIIFNVAGLFVLLDAVLISVILIILYLIITAALFFCGILIVDLNFFQMRKAVSKYSNVSSTIGLILVIELSVWFIAFLFSQLSSIDAPLLNAGSFSFSPLNVLAEKLYVDYFYTSHATMLILLVTIVGFVVLTIKRSETLRKDESVLGVEHNKSGSDGSY
jgi:NADH-quinone oxidoreductase subunit J